MIDEGFNFGPVQEENRDFDTIDNAITDLASLPAYPDIGSERGATGGSSGRNPMKEWASSVRDYTECRSRIWRTSSCPGSRRKLRVDRGDPGHRAVSEREESTYWYFDDRSLDAAADLHEGDRRHGRRVNILASAVREIAWQLYQKACSSSRPRRSTRRLARLRARGRLRRRS